MHRLSWPDRAHAALRAVRELVRMLNGDTAYARYVARWHAHGHVGQPLDRAAFFRAEVERRWNGVRRCC